MIREDYIHRLIRQLAEMLARAAGYSRRGDYAAALRETGRGWDELLGVPRELVEVLDTRTLAELLREPAKMRIAARLLGEEARALIGQRDPIHAGVVTRRALELYVAARAIDPTEDDDAAILELSRLVPADQIATLDEITGGDDGARATAGSDPADADPEPDPDADPDPAPSEPPRATALR